MTPTSPPQTCSFELDLKALLDGELPDARRHQVERHLTECASCSETQRQLRHLTLEVQAMATPVSCPESVTERVLNSLPERGPGRLRFFELSFVRWAAAGGLAAVLAAIIFPIFSQSREAARPMTQVASSPRATASESAVPSLSQDQMKVGAPPGGAAGMGGPSAPAPMGAQVAEAPASDPEARAKQFGQRNGDAYAGLDSRPIEVKATGGAPGDDVNKYVHGNATDEVLRRVVKSALMSVQVNERLETLQDRLAKKVVAEEGYVESMDLQSPPSGERTSRMALRVPVAKYESTIEYVSGLGEVKTKSMGGKDITGTWLEQRKSVRDLRAREERYAAAYRNARNRADREKARRQLLKLRPALQTSEEAFAETAKLAALARIDVTLVEEPQAKIRGDLGRDLQNTTKHASAAFLTTLRVPATLLIWLAIFTPLWLPCLIVYLWATRRARRL